MDLIEVGLVSLGEFVSSLISNKNVKSFIEDAIFGGFGAFLVFVPQIFILSFFIRALEDSGYLSRAALICNRFLSFFGLSGESFIPLLTSHACAIPGIYATRSIKSERVRVLTLLTLPLTVCSARLPVYALLITITIPQTLILGGLVGARGFSLFVLYLFGVFMSLIVSSFLTKTQKEFKTKNTLAAIQLTRYKWPDFTKALKSGLSYSFHFIKDAGLIIFLTNTFIWVLSVLPNGPGNLKGSYLSSIGKAVHFVFSPLGMSWEESVAVLTSFLARETFVSTLGTLYNLDSDEVLPLANLMMKAQSEHQMASALALIVFFAIALQCVSTVALLKTELPKKIWSVYLFGAYFVLAYVLSFVTYRVALIL
jgi:ferrous iron transport protein B